MGSLDIPRRAVVRGVTVTGVAAVAGFALARTSEAADPATETTAANGYGAEPGDAGRRLAALDDVPPGGGLVVEDVVLTRDDAGDVRGFSATCTHQGCTVSGVEGGVILCPCHGSSFDALTGSPVAGPAPSALAEVPVTVRDDGVFTA
jgi:Rieske Fe-S protein